MLCVCVCVCVLVAFVWVCVRRVGAWIQALVLLDRCRGVLCCVVCCQCVRVAMNTSLSVWRRADFRLLAC